MASSSPVRSSARLTTAVLLVLAFPLPALGQSSSSGERAPAGSVLVLTGTVVEDETATGSVLGPGGAVLSGVVVEVDGEETVTDERGRFAISVAEGAAGTAVAVRLLTESDEGPAKSVPVVRNPRPAPPSVAPEVTGAPAYAAVGDTVTLEGLGFRGRASEAEVRIGATQAPILASTSAEMVVYVPPDTPLGAQELTVSTETGPGTPVEVEVVRLTIQSGDTELVRGQSGEASLVVEGTRKPVTIEITNRSPEVIRLRDGDSIEVHTSGGEDNRAKVLYRAVRPGAWSLGARPTDPSRLTGRLCVYEITKVTGTGCPPVIRRGIAVCVRCPESRVCPRDLTWVLPDSDGRETCRGEWVGGGSCTETCPSGIFLLFKGF